MQRIQGKILGGIPERIPVGISQGHPWEISEVNLEEKKSFKTIAGIYSETAYNATGGIFE